MKRLILPAMALIIALGSTQFVGAVGRFDVPETGSSLGLLALGVLGLSVLARKLK